MEFAWWKETHDVPASDLESKAVRDYRLGA
jgi:hypothetical protein